MRWSALIVLLLVLASPAAAVANPIEGDAKRNCVYAAHYISKLNAFGDMVGHAYDCALVYNDAAPAWADWESPWFVRHVNPDLNWAKWKNAAPGRSLIVTQNLFPADQNATNWLDAGASGAYADHARALARNLVAAGLGDSVIRLAHEANGTWYPFSLPNTSEGNAKWVAFWRRTVLAMKSVPGASFRFDWCVNAAVRAIPLAGWYPGDDVVDFIGIDAYDAGIKSLTDRWATVYGRTLGIRDVLTFARAHGKPLTIPEWGVGPTTSSLAGGDDPEYVDGIAGVVRDNPVAYQAYFYNHEWATQLANGPLSLAAYRRHFGGTSETAAGPAATPPGGGTRDPAAETAPATAPAAGSPSPGATSRASIDAARTTSLNTARALAKSGISTRRGHRLKVRASAAGPGRTCVFLYAGSKPPAKAGAQGCKATGRPVASGSRAFARAGSAVLVARTAGPAARLLRGRGRRRLAVVAVFHPAGGKPSVSTRRVTVAVRR